MLNSLLQNPMIHGALLVAVGYFVMRLFVKVDNKVEARRRASISIAARMRANGLDWAAEFFEDYAVGDYDTLGVKLAKLHQLAENDAAMKDEFKKVLATLLQTYLSNDVDKDELGKMLDNLGHKLVPKTTV